MSEARRTALVILDTGSPARADEVESFLHALGRDRRGLPLPWWREPFRPILAQGRARRYGEAWRADLDRVTIDSPLERVSRGQAHGVAERLGCDGYAAVLFGRPDIAETVALMRAEQITEAILLAPEPQAPDDGAVLFAEFESRWLEAGGGPGSVIAVRGFADHADFVTVQARNLDETLKLLRDPVTPVLFLGRDPGQALVRPGLEDRARAQVAAISAALDLGDRVRLAWLPPRVDEPAFADQAGAALDRFRAENLRQVVLVPLGWVADRFETLYDIDMMLARRARESGMRVFRVPTLNDRPDFLEALARHVVRTRGLEERRG